MRTTLLVQALCRHPQSTRVKSITSQITDAFWRTKLTHSNPIPIILNRRRQFSSTNQNDANQIQTENIITIFPWRESAKMPLPRVISKDDLSNLGQTSYNKFAIKLASCVEMKEFSFWSFFISKKWEQDLANNSSWAFQVALSGLISRTFGLPFDSIENTIEGGVAVDAIVNSVKNNETTMNDKLDVDEENEMDETSKFIQSMVEEKLLSLYHPISTTQNAMNKYEVTFFLKPLASRLENIFMIPSLTRQDVNLNPSLKGAYLAINKAFTDKKPIEDLNAMSKELCRKTSHSGTKRSIIMDVSIDCAEIFQIKDLSSGKIMQGQRHGVEQGEDKSTIDDDANDLEPEMTTHLVRFEMVTSKGQRQGERVLGSWYIIDIDDQLNGNTWH